MADPKREPIMFSLDDVASSEIVRRRLAETIRETDILRRQLKVAVAAEQERHRREESSQQ